MKQVSEYAGKILIVDDESDILDFLEYNLQKDNYLIETCQDGNKAMEIAKEMIGIGLCSLMHLKCRPNLKPFTQACFENMYFIGNLYMLWIAQV